ncbi:caspase-1-like isoform X2 [Belonocnema kinseyi]|uniref:caspase-1-like isoform X2 n=1 Tax=Belonocnema kinseyi TaxID=2817044 RepID=UPI00143DDB46|nr:caspase-1-like isoform X2 [Belonocnema kinseyi]
MCDSNFSITNSGSEEENQGEIENTCKNTHVDRDYENQSSDLRKASPDQEYFVAPESVNLFMPDWLIRQPDTQDATPNSNDTVAGSSVQVAKMPTSKGAHCYNMNHKNRGKCVVFNHEIFDTGFDNREGSSYDAKRIERTFKNLEFTVEIHDNLKHSDILEKIETLQQEDHSENDCICIFILTHGLNNDLICAKDVAYSSDNIWKPFTAEKCTSLAGKPKIFFFQACRGDKLDSGILLQRSAVRTETDSAITSYKIPTHADFLIAHSTVQGFFSWRNPEEGTWYIKCLCEIIDEYADSTDFVKMLTMTARKVATEYESFHDLNLAQHEQKQVPSLTSMLIRDLYFFKKLSK